MSKGRFAGAMLALFLALPAAPASAQAVLGQSECRGSYQGIEIAGTVLADFWQMIGPSGASTEGTFKLFYQYLMRGEMDRIPGTVRLFGNMRDSAGNLVNFEVFLQGGNISTGSVWINGARHKETFMRLVVVNMGFEIYPETGDVARFACEIVG